MRCIGQKGVDYGVHDRMSSGRVYLCPFALQPHIPARVLAVGVLVREWTVSYTRCLLSTGSNAGGLLKPLPLSKPDHKQRATIIHAKLVNWV